MSPDLQAALEEPDRLAAGILDDRATEFVGSLVEAPIAGGSGLGRSPQSHGSTVPDR